MFHERESTVFAMSNHLLVIWTSTMRASKSITYDWSLVMENIICCLHVQYV